MKIRSEILKKTGIAILFFLSVNSANAQSSFCKTIWGVDSANPLAITATADSGCVILGFSINTLISPYAVHFIARFNAAYEVQWAKSFGVAGIFGSFLSGEVKQTTDGGFVCVVTTQANGNYDMLVTRFDSNGNELWHQVIGQAGSEYGNSIVQTADGGYLVAGSSDSFSSGFMKFFLVKLDASGSLIFSKTIGTAEDDLATSLIRTSDGGYVIAGSSYLYNGIPFGDLYIVKLNSSYNIQWSRIIGWPYFDRLYSIVQADDGGYVAGGVMQSTPGVGDYVLVKLSGNGVPEWIYHCGTPVDEYGWSLIKTHDGGYLVTGMAENPLSGRYNCYAVKVSATGQQVWGKILGASNSSTYTFATAMETADHSYLIAATYRQFSGPPYSKILLMKIDSTGSCCCDSGSYGAVDTVVVSTYTGASISNVTSTANNIILFAPLAMTADTLCMDTIVTTGTEPVTMTEDVLLYPNPAISELIVNSSEFGEIETIEIYSSLGEKVFEKRPTSDIHRLSISVADFLPGIYFVRLTDEKKNIVTRKFVKM